MKIVYGMLSGLGAGLVFGFFYALYKLITDKIKLKLKKS